MLAFRLSLIQTFFCCWRTEDGGLRENTVLEGFSCADSKWIQSNWTTHGTAFKGTGWKLVQNNVQFVHPKMIIGTTFGSNASLLSTLQTKVP